MMSLHIQGLGTAVPRLSIEQDAAGQAAQRLMTEPAQRRLLPVLFRRAQVERRGSVLLEVTEDGRRDSRFYPAAQHAEDRGPTTAARMERYAQEAGALASLAGSRALEAANVSAQAITHLVSVSCTGFVAPGAEFALIQQLGLRPTVGRLHVGFMGCHGALNALRAAEAFVASDAQAKVLLCAVELCSLHYQYGNDPQQLVANALFADGAAAMVAARDAAPHRWRLAGCVSLLMPDSAAEMGWVIGDHGFQMSLSPRVPELLQQHLRPWLERWLSEQGLSLEQIGSWAVHPGGPRIVSAVGEALALSNEALAPSLQVLAEHGNMSSPTVLFVIDRLQRAAAPRPCVVLAFGPGLVAEAALFR